MCRCCVLNVAFNYTQNSIGLFDLVKVEVSQDRPQQSEDGVGEGAEILHLNGVINLITRK